MVCYSFLNWYLTTKTKVLQIDEGIVDYWIPIIICFIFSFFVFKPLINLQKFSKNNSEFSFGLIPCSIALSVSFSQQYYRDKSYPVITIEKPTDILRYPNDRYFIIKHYFVAKERYFILRTAEKTGRFGEGRFCSDYYTVAMYNDSSQLEGKSKVAYGIVFSEHSVDSEIEEGRFNRRSHENYLHNDFIHTIMFEREINTDRAINFNNSWGSNAYSDKNFKPIVLTRLTRTISEIYEKDKELLRYSIGIYFVVVFLLFMFKVSSLDKIEPSFQ